MSFGNIDVSYCDVRTWYRDIKYAILGYDILVTLPLYVDVHWRVS